MKTLKVKLEERDIDRIPDGQLRQALVDAGMWSGDDERDPAYDHSAAWELVGKMTQGIGQGIILSMVTSDAFNSYGKAEDWIAFYQEFSEACARCESNPDHGGRHRWRREWVKKFSGGGLSFEKAVSRLALRYAFEVWDE